MELPRAIKSTPLPTVLEKKRYHDLDALRAFAMLLGIVLHGVLSFFPVPIWPAQDLQQPMVEVPAALAAPLEQAGLEVPEKYSLYEFALHAIHGFRLPLFFLVSGFFTAMLWRKRGLKALAKHRAMRILLPLVIFVPIIWILIIPVGIYGDFKKKEVATMQTDGAFSETKPKTSGQSVGVDIFTALDPEHVEALKQHIASGTDLETREPAGGSTPLMIAALYGNAEAARLLVEAGAKVNAKNKEGDTALHMAAFFCHTEIVELLLENGAEVNAKNNKGETPLSNVSGPWGQVEGIYKFFDTLLKLDLDLERVKTTRPVIAKMLTEAGGEQSEGGNLKGALGGLIMLIFFAPVFHHLWFLYYLAWLVAGFLLVTWLLGKLKWKALPDWLVTSPCRWLWLLPVTWVPQLMMPGDFGPATAVGFLPWPPILIYYAIFFGFGAVCYGRDSFENKTGKLWPLHFALAVPLLFAGLCLVRSGNNGPLLAACTVAYTWLMVFSFIGFFRQFFSGENKFIRYISDSSYWLYILHLPVIMFVQAWISPWDLPAFPKFLIACAATTLPLLLIYEFVVRYTFIGTMLNGKRTREPA
jgi:peptidoglycan/LPS O-acetylase OafA/YrhL